MTDLDTYLMVKKSFCTYHYFGIINSLLVCTCVHAHSYFTSFMSSYLNNHLNITVKAEITVKVLQDII